VSSTLLELAISMIFLYLMLSAASSAIQEIIANFFRWRAKTLEQGIAGLFGSSQFKDEFYKLPLVESLCSPNARGNLTHRPSYIAPATFALAVLDLAAKKGISLPGGAAPAVPADPAFAKPTALLSSLLLGAKDVEDQRKRLEGWFNDSMDRVSGWYKRTSNAWLWIIGGVLCLLMNADSISLAKVFWNDPALRAATVTAATEHVKNAAKEEQPKSTSPGNAASATGDSMLKGLSDVKKDLTQINVPLGWCWKSGGDQKKCFPNLGSSAVTANAEATDPRMIMPSDEPNPILWLFLKFVGITLTALAISQGAPFWFDLLQKAVNLRFSGYAPDEKKQK
jgi:hypothetical protein